MKTAKQELRRTPSEIMMRIAAIQLVNGKRQRDQIKLLSIAGMSPSEIAELIGTTPNTVNVALSSLRKANSLNLKFEETD
jgi:DNA-binding CsgD family transcriptional regulator